MTIQDRLSRGGDRAADSALHIIAIGRLRTDQKTKAYLASRIGEGHSGLVAIRALKRLAREVFFLIMQDQTSYINGLLNPRGGNQGRNSLSEILRKLLRSTEPAL